ncbi:MAG: HEPN domain-containing protein [Cytophagales bacterium]|nr:HEPN domain-containing protein [Cytophagales bacterium]MDW8385261.1 HEPN domain-containing protein [Flammeovirgaceae bacterium]
MLSFRTELEDMLNPVVAKDIIDLERQIRLYREGKIDDEKFRSLRLVRGIYGQRQPGVQMVRIKLPYGRITPKQIRRIADISEQYASGNLHATTRQDIQIHYVKLEHTPELWAKLEQDSITTREACGNTVRNITASAEAGIDPHEPFDVSPYAHAVFEYFLRNPICQDMGRKFKIAFSSSEKDTAFTFIHDIGFIPKIKIENGEEIRGFKVLIGGGLGANPYLAKTAFEFLHEDLIIPYIESILRIFDRYGERQRRMKARFKFLLEEIGMDELVRLIEQERPALKHKVYKIDRTVPEIKLPPVTWEQEEPKDAIKYDKWLKTNVFEQKQKGFYGVYIKLTLGDMKVPLARKFADIAEKFAADDIRITINQGYLLKYVRPDALPALFNALNEVGLAEPGFDSVADITACPGTDSCALGISSSTGVAVALENVIRNEYPDLIYNNDIKIKISGCPNSCGQHGLAQIGFHGSSIKHGDRVLPAVQILLGGARLGNGEGRIAEKVIKIPSKRADTALRWLLDDYEENALEGEYYSDYYLRKGEMYFYELLKPLTDLNTLQESDYLDWGQDTKFELLKAVGECAGVVIDLVATLLYETEEKVAWADENFEAGSYADAIYHAYNIFIQGAKAMLLTKDVRVNTHIGVLRDFDTHFTKEGIFSFDGNTFEDYVLRINKFEPTREFAETYIKDAKNFLKDLHEYRKTHQENPKSSTEKVKPMRPTMKAVTTK